MKKVVLRLDVYDEKSKRKALRMVSSLSGLVSLSMDMKDKKLTLTGDIDPFTIVGKLRKAYQTEIVSVEALKEPEKKKDEPKKDEPKKPEPKDLAQLMMNGYVQGYYNPSTHYYVKSVEEDPNACVIC